MRELVDTKKRGAKIAQLVSHEGTFPGSEYDSDQVELIQAMHRYMKDANVRYPSFTEVLEVAKKLGWRKVPRDEATKAEQQPTVVKVRKKIKPHHRKKRNRMPI